MASTFDLDEERSSSGMDDSLLDSTINTTLATTCDPTSSTPIAKVTSSRRGNFWVAADTSGRIVGMIGLFSHRNATNGSDRGELRRMSVSREYRGTGLAKR